MSDNSEVIGRYRAAVEAGDLVTLVAFLDDFATDDFAQEWPQSGERLRLEASKRMAEQYAEATGTNPKMQLKGIKSCGDLAVIEGTIDYGNGVPVSYVGVAEFRDGKVAKATEYFADPFEAPAWRAPFVEQMAGAGK